MMNFNNALPCEDGTGRDGRDGVPGPPGVGGRDGRDGRVGPAGPRGLKGPKSFSLQINSSLLFFTSVLKILAPYIPLIFPTTSDGSFKNQREPKGTGK